MKQNGILVITSLLTILLTTLHLADDIVRGMSPGGLSNLPVVLVLVVWLYGTLVLVGQRSGYVITLVAPLLASALPVVHMTNRGGAVGGGIAESSGAFFFAWTIIALVVTAIFSVILSARGLWSLRRGQRG
ncbi:MAG TPA: hypothetical protein VMT00_16475 [Thermoanaerobaculia bacterium]|nr:hypothetical protein [Thermoanaerobaculia bacterium]